MLDLAGSTERLAAALRETDVLDLALVLQLLQLLDRLLDRGLAIEAVGIVCPSHISTNPTPSSLLQGLTEIDVADSES